MNLSTDKECIQFTIFGERCSGTNYIEELMLANFHINYTCNYGWKHMSPLPDCSDNNSSKTLFIGVIRNELDWLNSFKRTPHHISPYQYRDLSKFMFNPLISLRYNGSIIESTNNNIFELRARKNTFLKETMPTLVENYVLFQYEDISKNYESILTNLQSRFNLKPKSNKFVNIKYYKKRKDKVFVPKPVQFTYKDIQELAKKRGMMLTVTDAPDGTSTLKLDTSNVKI